MKNTKKRGRYFAFISISIGLMIIISNAIFIFVIKKAQDAVGVNSTGYGDFVIHYWLDIIFFTIALIGIIYMFFTLKRVGFYIYISALGLVVVNSIILDIRMSRVVMNIDHSGLIFIIVVALVWSLLFLPVYYRKLKKKEISSNIIRDKQENIQYSVQGLPKKFQLQKKISTKHIIIGSIGVLLLVGGAYLIFFYLPNKSIRDKKEAEELRIADSVRIADSLAMVKAENQRIADSIENQRIADAAAKSADNDIINKTKDVINLFYKFSQENAYNDFQNLFSDNVEQYYSLKNIKPETIVKDRENFSKRFSLTSYDIDFNTLKVSSDKERTYFEVSYDLSTIVHNIKTKASTKYFASISMKLNNTFKIYYITEAITSKEEVKP